MRAWEDEEEEAVDGRKELVTTCSQRGVQSEQQRFLSSLQGDDEAGDGCWLNVAFLTL